MTNKPRPRDTFSRCLCAQKRLFRICCPGTETDTQQKPAFPLPPQTEPYSRKLCPSDPDPRRWHQKRCIQHTHRDIDEKWLVEGTRTAHRNQNKEKTPGHNRRPRHQRQVSPPHPPRKTARAQRHAVCANPDNKDRRSPRASPEHRDPRLQNKNVQE